MMTHLLSFSNSKCSFLFISAALLNPSQAAILPYIPLPKPADFKVQLCIYSYKIHYYNHWGYKVLYTNCRPVRFTAFIKANI